MITAVSRRSKGPGGLVGGSRAHLKPAAAGGAIPRLPGGETEQGITYAKWMQCSGERSSRQHASERISELHQHVILPSFDPNGESRVDRIARAVLNAPVPAVVTTLAAHSSLQCMECEE